MNDIVSQLSSSLHVTPHEVNSLLSALSICLRDNAVQGNSVALPAIGTFSPVMHHEKIVDDATNPGGKVLLPPEIVLQFTPSTTFKKHLKNG